MVSFGYYTRFNVYLSTKVLFCREKHHRKGKFYYNGISEIFDSIRNHAMLQYNYITSILLNTSHQGMLQRGDQAAHQKSYEKAFRLEDQTIKNLL